MSYIVREYKMLNQKKYKKYSGIFIGDCGENMDLKEHDSGTSMSQTELLRTNYIRFYGIL